MRGVGKAAFLVPLLLLSSSSAADPPDDPAARAAQLLAEARAETRAIDELLDAAGSRAVQHELHRKTRHLAELHDELATILSTSAFVGAGDVSWSVDATDAGAAAGLQVWVDDRGVSVVVGGDALPTDTRGGVDIDDHDHDDDGAVADPPPPVVASESELAGILAAVEGESFSDGKLAVLRSAAMDRWFTAAQARRLVESLDFGKDKVAAGTLLFPRVVDPDNWYVVYDAFDFDSDKEALRRAVGR